MNFLCVHYLVFQAASKSELVSNAPLESSSSAPAVQWFMGHDVNFAFVAEFLEVRHTQADSKSAQHRYISNKARLDYTTRGLFYVCLMMSPAPARVVAAHNCTSLAGLYKHPNLSSRCFVHLPGRVSIVTASAAPPISISCTIN